MGRTTTIIISSLYLKKQEKREMYKKEEEEEEEDELIRHHLSSEKWITLFLGITLAGLNTVVFAAIYGSALSTNQLVFGESNDVSISRSFALLGADGGFVSIVSIMSALIFTLITFRQKLRFPLLAFLYGFGALCFATLPIITSDISIYAHAVLALGFFGFLTAIMILTTMEYKKYNIEIPLIFMYILDVFLLIGAVSAIGSCILAVADSSSDKEATVWFTITEFLIGFVLIVFMIIVALPMGNLSYLTHLHHD